MKPKNNAGFSLVEVLVAIVLLGTLVVPICSSLVLTFRMNEKTDSMLRAQLAVSSAVETLLAEGISEEKIDEIYDGTSEAQAQTVPITYNDGTGRFAQVIIDVYVDPSQYVDSTDTYLSSYDCYLVKVTSRDDNSVFATTMIREREEVAAS